MNRKTLYLHIGMGKTGTTALQDFFWTNRVYLAENDISYPNIGVQSGAHHLLSPHIPPFLKDVWDFMNVEKWAPKVAMAPESKVLLSSELMAWAANDIAVNFCESISEWFDTKVIIYLRRQDHIIMAGYNQQIKAGMQIRNLHSIIDRQLARFDYEKIISPWESVLGSDNIIVRPYEKEQFYLGDIRKDYMKHVFGLEFNNEPSINNKNLNPRLAFSAMEYKRIINNLIKDTQESSRFNEILLQYSTSADVTSSNIFATQSILSPSERINILDKVDTTNKMIAQKYLKRDDERLFLEPMPNIDDDWVSSVLSDEDMSSIYKYIHGKSPKLSRILTAAVKKGFASSDINVANMAERVRSNIS